MNVKRVAAKALADMLAAAVPEFAVGGGVQPAPDDSEDAAKYPALIIVPRTLTFSPWQDDELLADDDPASDASSLVHVGDFEGLFELRLYALTQYDRGELEQRVLDQFMADIPGQIVANTASVLLGGVQTLWSAPIVARLEDETWRDEMVFEKKRFTFLNTTVTFPALSLRSAPTIDSVQLAIADDLAAVTPDVTYLIDENGNLT